MIVDAHAHFPRHMATPGAVRYGSFEPIIADAERLGVGRLAVSVLPFLFNGKRWTEPATAGELRQAWGIFLELHARYPAHVLGYAVAGAATVGAGPSCVGRMVEHEAVVGIKLDLAPRVDDPVWEPVFALAAENELPVLVHCSKRLLDPVAGETEPEHLAEVARRHPHVKFIMAHLGLDWLWARRVVADLTNIHLDTSGMLAMAGSVEDVVGFLGADRVIFGSDLMGRSLGDQLGRVTGARIGDDDKGKILGRNFLSLVPGGVL
jgi:hypothetical protein